MDAQRKAIVKHFSKIPDMIFYNEVKSDLKVQCTVFFVFKRFLSNKFKSIARIELSIGWVFPSNT